MSVNGYQFDNLNQTEIDKIQNLELELNKNRQETDQLLLLAFKEKNE